ncbi:MAG TPA: translation initiation factor IF-2, partial [Taishania sp.]|nr:translation initiation factor IF-2 [Taishania sp.]
MAGKPIRLGKAAGELNVGISTLVDFLDSKGIKIDSNPNSKLEEEHYSLLRQEFAADHDLKEQTKQNPVKREKRETISLKDTRGESAETVSVESPKEEAPVEKKEEVKKKVEEPKVEPVVEVKSEPVQEAKTIGDGDVKVQVIGKIDLDSLNTKTRPDKKKKEEPAPKKEEVKAPEVKKPEPVVEAKPIEVKQEVKEEKVVEVAPKVEETPHVEEIETIRVQSQTLTGPKVLGKIELPVEKPKTPGQHQSNADRKKRKRIKKIDVNKQAQQQQQANSNQSNNNTGQNKNFKKGGQHQRVEKPEISEQDIQKEIKETLARLSSKGAKSKGAKNRRDKRDRFAQRRHEEELQAEMEQKVLKLTEFVTVSELANMMNVQPTQVIAACMSLGIFASINQRLDAETIQIVADEFGFETEFVSVDVQDAIHVVEDKEEDLVSRPPIITVMGHVDHGKTSLLDKIRNANVTEGEAGGITQHIGAYSVVKDGKRLTFLDTPGHEAFTAMRARGAQVTDVAIIIVAADDDVMPQTKEAISHAQAAGVPMVFAINKIDKPGANPDKIREQLSQMNILVEEWGGKYQSQEISAKQNINIDLLLEKVLLEAEMLNLRANPNKNAMGVVIESSLDKGKGYVTNMLVEAGTLRIGDVVLVGRNFGKVRAMHDEKG